MRLKILTYNIHKGFNTLGSKFVLHEIKNSLIKTKADILFLQEVVGENIIYAKNLKHWPKQSQFEFLADTVWTNYSYGKNAVFPERHHGNAVLSKYPISFQENLNISSNRLEQRGLLHCQIDIVPLKKKIHLFNTHIDLMSSGRRTQIQKIRNRILTHTHSHEPLIFAGDFNDWGYEVTDMLQDEHLHLDEAHLSLHGMHAKTFPAFFPFLSLDRTYFRGFKPVSSEVLYGRPWSQLSDHLPMLVEFEIS